ncbi:hypothetical protein I203_104637 [Kwoniella mangroviensis CBS 8507]|uniref:uncharacterized protein n=1 Tax=Kwoniella mangroviensis CBS 8507 TaxID=1296122 RepID=UPI00080D5386|nr:uncharacterized protein I203_00416 [Kwoniella mangroviensis CBS 8507]OCF70284.1 hypothetical protein I203_00416 [Kwoniella mangroviensis CBS 8507]
MTISQHPSPEELHLLYVLLDSNLPTGGFVSSSGLESFAKHGLLSPIPPSYSSSGVSLKGRRSVGEGITEFAKVEVENYSMTTCIFVIRAYQIVHKALSSHLLPSQEQDTDVEGVVEDIIQVDKYNESTLLNHVGRRASRAQGVAMLTLYTRGLSNPAESPDDNQDGVSDDRETRTKSRAKKIIDLYKRCIRGNKSPGHLAVCWGVMTACIGLSLDRSIHLHLFLHARSLLSSAVRLNLIGPYASSQLLLHPFKRIIDDQVEALYKDGHLDDVKSQCQDVVGISFREEEKEGEDDFWSWADETNTQSPKTTWPLGEILMSRHDLQHSRIFNS